ncbi:MAG: response regulator transcription factor [Bacteroidota bacterium]
MKTISTLIIDDEEANRDTLGMMLAQYCPEVRVLGTASSVESGFHLISETNPNLVFLDIRMPEKTGFDLLRLFTKIDFHVIFVSAFDQYAIQAFEFNAVDYILKPIDPDKLVNAVNKTVRNIQNNAQQNVLHFVHSIDEKSALIKRISLHHQHKVHLIDIDTICYVRALREYCEITDEGGQKFISSKTLSDYEDLLRPFPNFLRVNKSVIINIHHVSEYTKGTDCMVTLNNDTEIEVSRRKKTSILQYLKGYIG